MRRYRQGTYQERTSCRTEPLETIPQLDLVRTMRKTASAQHGQLFLAFYGPRLPVCPGPLILVPFLGSESCPHTPFFSPPPRQIVTVTAPRHPSQIPPEANFTPPVPPVGYRVLPAAASIEGNHPPAKTSATCGAVQCSATCRSLCCCSSTPSLSQRLVLNALVKWLKS